MSTLDAIGRRLFPTYDPNRDKTMQTTLNSGGGTRIGSWAPDNPNAPLDYQQASQPQAQPASQPTGQQQGTSYYLPREFETSQLPYNAEVYNAPNQQLPSIGAPTRDNLVNAPSQTAGWQNPYADPVNLLDWGFRPRHEVDILQQAKDMATLEYNPLKRALEGSMSQAEIDYNAGQTAINKFGELADPQLAQIAQSLQAMLGEGKQANQQGFQDAIQAIQGFYGQSGAANENLYNDLMSRITTDAERLGTEAGLTEGTAGLTRDYAFNQMLGQNAQAGRTSNLGQLAAQIGALDQQRMDNAGLEWGQKRGDLQTQLLSELGNLGAQYGTERAGLRSQLQGLEQDRGAAIRSAFEALKQQQFDNRQTARQSALQEFLSRTELGRGNFESDRAYDLAREQFGLEAELGRGNLQLGARELSLKQQQLQQDARIAEAELAQITDPIERQYKQAQIDKIYADIAAMGGDEAGGPYAPGRVGMDQWIQNTGASPLVSHMSNQVIDFVEQNLEVAKNNYDNNLAAYAFDTLNKYRQNNSIPDNEFRNIQKALEIYFAGYGVG